MDCGPSYTLILEIGPPNVGSQDEMAEVAACFRTLPPWWTSLMCPSGPWSQRCAVRQGQGLFSELGAWSRSRDASMVSPGNSRRYSQRWISNRDVVTQLAAAATRASQEGAATAGWLGHQEGASFLIVVGRNRVVVVARHPVVAVAECLRGSARRGPFGPRGLSGHRQGGGGDVANLPRCGTRRVGEFNSSTLRPLPPTTPVTTAAP